jgi:TPP-dependent pyruvate/acetoin dehydrogenase alpha subunit
MDLLPEELLDAYRKMKRIRVFEEKLNDLVTAGRLAVSSTSTPVKKPSPWACAPI